MGCCQTIDTKLKLWYQPLHFDHSWLALPCFETIIDFKNMFQEVERKQYKPLLNGKSCKLQEWLERWLKYHLSCYSPLPKGDPYQHYFFRTQITVALIRCLSFFDSSCTLERSIVATFPSYSRFVAHQTETMAIPCVMFANSLRQLILFWCAIPQDQVFTWFDHLFDAFRRYSEQQMSALPGIHATGRIDMSRQPLSLNSQGKTNQDWDDFI